MDKFVSPIERALQGFAQKHVSADGRDAGIILSAVRGIEILQLAGWKGNMSALRSMIGEAVGLEVGDIGESGGGALLALENSDFTLLPMGFEKYWLVGEKGHLPSSLLALGSSTESAQTGVSVLLGHAVSVLGLGGEAVGELLPLLFRIDVSPDVFGVGRVATTSYQHARVTLQRRLDHSYRLYLPSSTAESLTESITQTASQFNLQTK